MKNFSRLIFLIIFTVIIIFADASYRTGRAAAADKAVPPFLQIVNKHIVNYFYRLGVELAHTADHIASQGIGSPESRKEILEICKKYPYITNCAIVSPDGKLAVIEPAEFKSSEGMDISGQAHYVKLKETRKPVLSDIFESVQKFKSISLQYPVIGENSKFIGSVSILIKPELFFHDILSPLISGLPVTVLLVQTDGVLLFSQAKEEISQNIFEKNMFKNIKNFEELTAMIKRDESGSAELIFADGPGASTSEAALAGEVKRNVYWLTCGLFDTKWRLIMASNSNIEKLSDKGVTSLEETEKKLASAAEALVNEPGFIAGVETLNAEATLNRLKIFYESNPRIYSAQWIDKDIISRGGYPVEKSFKDYDYKPIKTPRDKIFVDSFASGAFKSFSLQLVEGGTGKFYLYPVKSGGKMVGMFYYIIKVK